MFLGGETTEIKVEVSAEVWQKFEQMSGDVGKDRSAVLTEIISKAHAEMFPKPDEPQYTSCIPEEAKE
jgi:hypothetical protein